MNPHGSTNYSHANLTHKTRINEEFEKKLQSRRTQRKIFRIFNEINKEIEGGTQTEVRVNKSVIEQR